MAWLGIALTSVWIVLITIIVILNKNLALDLTLNEWGDFLAGITAPIAFLWLIIGYFQQSKELTLNTQALLNQSEELKRQADEIKQQTSINERLARAAEDQASIIRSQHRQTRLEKRLGIRSSTDRAAESEV